MAGLCQIVQKQVKTPSGFDIRNRQISVYDISPFFAGTNEPSEQVLIIMVK